MATLGAKDERFRAEARTGNAWKVALKVGGPLALYSWLNQFFNVLDTLMASHISSEAVSTVAYMVQIQHIVQAIGAGLSTACGIMVAHAYGRGDADEIKRSVSTALAMCAVLAVVIFIAVPFTPVLLPLMGTPDVFVATGSAYFSVQLVSIAAQSFNMIYIACERCRGRAGKILAINLGSVGVKLSITAVSVYVLEGGIISIAAASLLSHLAVSVAAIVFFRDSSSPFGFSAKAVGMRGEPGKGLLKLGAPSMVEKMAFSWGKALVNNMASLYGANVVGAAGISNNMSGLLTNIQSGFQDGAASLTGQLFGAGDFDRAIHVYRRCQAIILAIGMVGSGVMYLLMDPVARLFSLSRGGYDPAFHQMIKDIFSCELFGCMPLSFAYAGMAVLLGMGKTKLILLVNFMRIFAFRIPVIWALVTFTSLGHEAVGIAMAVSNSSVGIFALVLSEIVIFRQRRQNSRVKSE